MILFGFNSFFYFSNKLKCAQIDYDIQKIPMSNKKPRKPIKMLFRHNTFVPERKSMRKKFL